MERWFRPPYFSRSRRFPVGIQPWQAIRRSSVCRPRLPMNGRVHIIFSKSVRFDALVQPLLEVSTIFDRKVFEMTSASLLKAASCCLGLAPLTFVGAGPVLAQGATITLSDPNCVRFALAFQRTSVDLRHVCTTPTPPPTPGTVPTGCVASISPSPPTSAGGTVTVGVSGCSPGGSHTGGKNGLAWNSGNILTDTLPANLLTTAVTTTY